VAVAAAVSVAARRWREGGARLIAESGERIPHFTLFVFLFFFYFVFEEI